jgi:peptidoglycan/LPS O-acetylase OafA/YrhL
MESKDLILLLHPVAAVIFVFPLLGVVVNRALQVRQRRLEDKSKIPAVVGQEHVRLGRWLTGSVVGIVLLALANDVFGNILQNDIWGKEPFKVIFVGLMFGAAIASLTLLYKAQSKLWRAAFATLSSMALIVLGAQDGVYRKTEQWYVSHYYYGITAAVLMIISLTILREIYQDRTHRWRTVHIVLNSIALLLFIGQGITGTQALLEVPLHWQEPYVQKLYELQCEQKPCTVQPSIGSMDKPKN